MSNKTPSVADAELAKIAQAEPAHGRFKVLRWLVALALLAGLAAGGWAYFHSKAETQAAPQYQTEPLGQGSCPAPSKRCWWTTTTGCEKGRCSPGWM